MDAQGRGTAQAQMSGVDGPASTSTRCGVKPPQCCCSSISLLFKSIQFSEQSLNLIVFDAKEPELLRDVSKVPPLSS
jgi:hypothetical protein